MPKRSGLRISPSVGLGPDRIDPTGLANLAFGLRSTSGITLAGADVETFTAYSTGTPAFTQADAGKRPAYSATGMGGLPSLVFAGGTDLLEYAGQIVSDTGDQEGHIVASVLEYSCAFLSVSDTAGGDNNFWIAGLNAGGQFFIWTSEAGVTKQVTGNTSLSVGASNVLSWTFDGTNYKLWVNGVAQTLTVTAAHPVGIGSVPSADTSCLGALKLGAGPLLYLNGSISEVCIFSDDKTAAVTEKTINSLMKRYAI